MTSRNTSADHVKRCYFIGPALNDWQYAVQVESISRHSNPDDVEIYICGMRKFPCGSNIFGLETICSRCRNNAAKFVAKAFPRSKCTMIEESSFELPVRPEIAKSIEVSAISTLNSNLRPVKHNLTGFQAQLLERLLIAGNVLYSSIEQAVDSSRAMRFSIFNGRTFPASVLLVYLKERKIEFEAVEFNQSCDGFYIFPGATPHDINYSRKLINTLKKPEFTTTERAIVEKFYFQKKSSQSRLRNFSVLLEPIPEKFEGKFIAIFMSSDDELSSLGPDWESEFTFDIPKTLRRILEVASNHFFVVRLHPNQVGQGPRIVSIYRDIERSHKNVRVIYPKDRVNSYSIMEHAHLVLSFGSTMSVEATFWGKPSILLGKQVYDECGAVYTPQTEDELIRMLNSGLPPKGKFEAYSYALFVCRKGDSFRNVDGEIGAFRFKNIKLSLPFDLLYLLAKTLAIIRLRRADLIGRPFCRLVGIKLGLSDCSGN